MKKLAFLTILVIFVSIMLSGCAQPTSLSNATVSSPIVPTQLINPTETPPSTSQTNFLVCLATPGNTLFDKSFAQNVWEGFQKAEKELGVKTKAVTSSQATDWAPNIEALVSEKCDLIVTIGFAFGDVTAAAAKKYPEQKFVIVDYNYDNPNDYPNVKQIIFQIDEATFLAGYLSAGMTQTGKLGTFGGEKFPTVTLFMDGFAAGMHYYNKQHNASVQLLGWDTGTQTGLFTGDFINQDNGRRTTETLLQQGADIIMPVAGPVGLGATAAIRDAGKGLVVWVDSDGCVAAEEYCSLFLTSAEKRLSVVVFDAIKETMEGKFESGIYIGTLANGGVGISPYHDLSAKVTAQLDQEMTIVRQDVIDGKVKISDWVK
jgi:basic membrane protein A